MPTAAKMPPQPNPIREAIKRLQKTVDVDALRQSPRQVTLQETEDLLDLCMWQAKLIVQLDEELNQ